MIKVKKSQAVRWASILSGKAILLGITFVLAIATIAGFAINYVLGIVFSIFLIIAIRALIGADQIEEVFNKIFNDDDGPFIK
jgi:hypothetical protein